jgi:uncharacterized protein
MAPHPHATLRPLPRDARFDWSDLPLHWIPGHPLATHFFNAAHLLNPHAERWFCQVFEHALPLITDERLHERVLGFIGQERLHAQAHEEVHHRLRSLGLDIDPYLQHLDWYFQRALHVRPGLSPRRHREQLAEMTGFIAVAEHVTALISQWGLSALALDAAGTHPAMLDMFRWHAAEEVEHSSVSFDLLRHLDPRYRRRLRTAALAGAAGPMLMVRGVRYLIAADPVLKGRVACDWRAYRAESRQGLVPSLPLMLNGITRYLRPGYHPSHDFNLEIASAYLARSPAARAANHL